MARMTFVLLLVLVTVCASMADWPKQEPLPVPLPEPIPEPKPLPRPKEKCCGKNEVWTTCGNSCLEPRCDGSHKNIMCPAVCMERCQCVKGTLRNKRGKCVEPCDC